MAAGIERRDRTSESTPGDQLEEVEFEGVELDGVELEEVEPDDAEPDEAGLDEVEVSEEPEVLDELSPAAAAVEADFDPVPDRLSVL